jgi:signal transduction histidine kinase/ligand-binding sensor domain-containing protein
LSGSSTCRSLGPRARRLAAALVLMGTVAAVSAPTSVGALDAERSISQYIRDRWTTESGFPGGPVYAIAQTSDGYLWIGAEKGLVRFDGLTFRLLDPGSRIDAGPAVLGVEGAPDGSLWARLKGTALVRYHGGIFHNLLADVGPPASVVSAMSRGRNDVVLLAMLGRGAMTYRNGRFASLATEKMLPSSSFVISMAEATNGEIWLGSRDAGLFRVRGTNVTRYTAGLPDLKINALLAGPNGEVWIGTDRGVARWNGTEITQSGIPAALHQTPVLHMMRDRESNVWMAAGSRGLLRVRRDGAVHAAADAGWSLGHVSSAFEDRDGNLWVGTDRGIERWRDPVFTTWSTAQGMPPDANGPVYAADDGRVWFGPSSGGLFWIRDGVVHQVKEAGLADDVVYSIHGGNREVWVGRQRGGIAVLRVGERGGDEVIAAERFTQRQGLAQDSVFAVHRARDGAVWAGTLSAGASVFRQGRFATYDTRNGLPSNTVASILEASDLTMWFGTPNGLTAFSRGGWRTYTTGDGLPSNDINTLFEDRLGVMWVGTAKGIAMVSAGRVARAGATVLLLRRSILGFADDQRGSLWINTADGILRVNREGLIHDALQDNDVRQYGVADGLLAVESVKRHGIVTQDVKGRIWFALTRGLSMADPARADGRGLPAVTFVEQVTADGASIDVRGPIRIPSSRRRIAVGYAGLSLSVPERVRFRYRLEGFDREWSDPVAERQAVYTNLAPGPYRFRVIASNSDGLWNGTEASLPFEIQPLLWQTAWFQVTAVALTGLAGWGLYRLRVHQVARRLNARFEERLAERTHIAQELHDTLLQGFVSASMQLHVAVEGLPEDSPARASLGRVHDLMRRVIDEGRNAVRGLRSSSTSPRDLEQAFAGVQQEVGIGGAEYRVIVEGRPRSLKPIIRDEVYRIGREGLVNAFRHAQATHIEIELEYGARELCVFVRDDGRGVDPRVVRAGSDGHWGITGMRERAHRIGGTLKIRSRADAGTEVELRIPAHVAFERQTKTTETQETSGLSGTSERSENQS